MTILNLVINVSQNKVYKKAINIVLMAFLSLFITLVANVNQLYKWSLYA